MQLSIIICSRNRAGHLRDTLRSLEGVDVPDGVMAEALLVDNCSTDDTAACIEQWQPKRLTRRYLREERGGKSYALNNAVVTATGDILLFADDDVRFPQDWLQLMTASIVAGRASAVQGGIRIAPHLMRPWMTDRIRENLAHVELAPGETNDLIGANMAICRSVFEKVPGFDVELGPGPAAGGEDTLFGWQMREAGFRIETAPDAVVEHHFDESRLTRRSLLHAAQKGAYSDAYIRHHWLHEPLLNPTRHLIHARLRLAYFRARRWNEWHRNDRCTDWEIGCVKSVWVYRHYLREVQRPRNYERKGLSKIAGHGINSASSELPVGIARCKV
jgi:glycosyltransferase involved in cell wall biosynthesis